MPSGARELGGGHPPLRAAAAQYTVASSTACPVRACAQQSRAEPAVEGRQHLWLGWWGCGLRPGLLEACGPSSVRGGEDG